MNAQRRSWFISAAEASVIASHAGVLGELVFQTRDEKQAPLKTAAWEATSVTEIPIVL